MSAGVAGRPLVGCDLFHAGRAGSSGGDFRRLVLAQTVAAELETVGVVDDAVENGVGQGRLAGQVVPAVDRDLAGDQGGAAAVAVLDDLKACRGAARGRAVPAPNRRG